MKLLELIGIILFSGANMVTIATFEEVKNIKPDVYLIDVRERNELEETGTIPHSINIPCKINLIQSLYLYLY